MQQKLSCIIVDDDEIDRLTTLSFIKKIDFIHVSGVYDSAESVLKSVAGQTPDLLLADIDMPGLSGLELREQLLHIPVCIFITAYPDYAVESFEKEAFDFLVKPLKHERFLKAMTRLQEYFTMREKASLLEKSMGGDVIFIKEGHQQVKINLHEVIYLEALKDYTAIVTSQKRHFVLSPISGILREPSFQSFVRIHRSYAIQKNYVQKITANEVFVSNVALPVGRSFKNALSNI